MQLHSPYLDSFFSTKCLKEVNSLVRYLITVTSARANTAQREAVFKDNASMQNRLFNQVKKSKKPDRQQKKIKPLYLLNGLDKWIRIIKPTMDKRYVLAVPISASGRLNNWANNTSAAIETKDVREAGNALRSVWVMKCPFCFPSLASNARKKEGMPMLNMDTRDIWDGFKG